MLPARCLSVIVLCATLLQAAELNRPAPKFPELSGYRGQVVFINFWASWCAPCQVELPELNRLAARYRGKNVKVLAINVDRDRRAAKKLLSRLGLTAPHLEILWDTKSKVVSAYNIEGMPSSFILDAHGIIRFKHAGFHSQDPESWRHEIDRLLGLKG